MLSTGSQAGELALSHTDPAWKDGKGKVPDIGICEARNVGGKGMSPSIEITGIPSGTVKLELHFTDEDWHAGEGAHGVVGFPVPAGSKSVIVPSFKGETDKLPANIEAISSHEAQMLAGGVYLGPCLMDEAITTRSTFMLRTRTAKNLQRENFHWGNIEDFFEQNKNR